MLRKVALVVVAVAGLAVTPPLTASASPPDLQVGDLRLTLSDGPKGALCLVVDAGADSPDGVVDSFCDVAPRGLDRPPIVSADDGVVAGVVPAAGETVQLFFRGIDGPVTVPTKAPERYRGRRAVRLFLLPAPAAVKGRDPSLDLLTEDGPYAVRVLDRNGALVAVYDQPGARAPAAGPVTVSAGRARVLAIRSSALAPIPGEPEHRSPTVCFQSSGGFATCADADLDPSGAPLAITCRGDRLQLSGLLSSAVRSARVLLGDGRLRTVRIGSLKAIGIPAGAFAFEAPRATALRALELRGTGGARRRYSLALAPGGLDCNASGHIPADVLPRPADAVPTGPSVEVSRVTGHALSAADALDGRLCLRLDGAPPRCAYPQPTRTSEPGRGTGPDGTSFFSVPADVVRVEAVLSDGSVRRVATAPAGAYPGRYAATVRFALVVPGRGREVVGIRRFGAEGQFLGTSVTFGAQPFSGPARLRARLPGGVRLWRVRTASAGETAGQAVRRERVDCVVVGPRRPASSDECRGLGAGSIPAVTLEVACRTHRVVVVSAMPPGARGLVARLQGGTVRRARIARAARAAGRRIAVVSLRPSERLAGLATTGRVRLERRFRLPPGARQCGYQAEFGLTSDVTGS